MKYKRTIIKYLVPFIMLFFFVRNIILVETHHLDSWMGGGMRMFGKIDKMLYRVSGFTVEHNNKIYFVNLRNIEALEDIYVESKILPSEHRLESILKDIKSYTWCYNEEMDAITIKSDKACSEEVKSENIKNMQVYRVHYNNEKNRIKLELINDVENL
ncbi:hypothetical protein [Flavivirga sp. 57AJ16]|uniref:hypothetical protein n=1 Tax=Flavivirga sp. 57AJ16 TaxID=3025307 RepID=UPI0023662935|nr:hypothetical protein [Flavivirga sp. 57AJ16]MDD7885829.1 hypothetical protein [Flavivirga sp. 57AJ16]